MISCYLYDGEQGSSRNVELLARAQQVAKASGCPWLIGMDGQQQPSELLKWAAPLIDRADGAIASPAEPTHFPGVSCSRCLGYVSACRTICGRSDRRTSQSFASRQEATS